MRVKFKGSSKSLTHGKIYNASPVRPGGARKVFGVLDDGGRLCFINAHHDDDWEVISG